MCADESQVPAQLGSVCRGVPDSNIVWKGMVLTPQALQHLWRQGGFVRSDTKKLKPIAGPTLQLLCVSISCLEKETQNLLMCAQGDPP